MTCIRHISITAALLVLLPAGIGRACAQDQGDPRASAPPTVLPRPSQDASRQSRHNSLSDSVRRVRSEMGGQVLGAERLQFDGRDINRVKYLDERGRVRYMEEAGQSRRQGPPRPPRDVSPPPARGDNPDNP